MKPSTLFLLFLIIGLKCSGQNFQLHLIGTSDSENKILDSINYNSNHSNVKSLTDEIHLTSEKLSKKGFIENRILETTKENDSSYTAKFNLGIKTKSIHIYIGRNSTLLNLIALDKTKDTIILPYEETETFLNQTLLKLEQKGFALAKLKLINIQKKKNILYTDLQFESGQQRQLNSIVVKFAESNKKIKTFPHSRNREKNNKWISRDYRKFQTNLYQHQCDA